MEQINIVSRQEKPGIISDLDLLQPGDARIIKWLQKSDEEPKYILILSCPGCGSTRFTSEHTHIFHRDGTVTLEPSINCHCTKHYYIKRNKIIDV